MSASGRQSIPWAAALLAAAVSAGGPASGSTFTPASISPDEGIDVFTKGAARESLGRDVFSSPYATVLVATVDVYDVFPFLEARYIQIVSDPRWSRLVFGERGGALRAFDGAGTTFGPLSEPRGMAVDPEGRLYVCDSGNHRVLIFDVRHEFDDVALVPAGVLDDLSRPLDVAHSDGGTPFDPDDDVLYVAETGRNRVARFEASDGRFVPAGRLGSLGSGPDRFAGPTAVAAGRRDGANTGDLFVADAHNGRIVHLQDTGSGLRWIGEAPHEGGAVTSLDADHWGNIYAASPARGVTKFNPDLARVASLDGTDRPRSFHLPFVNVRDHGRGTRTRTGRPLGFSVSEWSAESGIGIWALGPDFADARLESGDSSSVAFTLTDPATLEIEVIDGVTGRRLAYENHGLRAAGRWTLPVPSPEPDAGGRVLLLRARSAYEEGGAASLTWNLDDPTSGTDVARPLLLGNSPNPFAASTRIRFLLPAGARETVSIRVFDAGGRRVLSAAPAFDSGLVSWTWNGRDDEGRPLASGIYPYTIEVGGLEIPGKMVLLR